MWNGKYERGIVGLTHFEMEIAVNVMGLERYYVYWSQCFPFAILDISCIFYHGIAVAELAKVQNFPGNQSCVWKDCDLQGHSADLGQKQFW